MYFVKDRQYLTNCGGLFLATIPGFVLFLKECKELKYVRFVTKDKHENNLNAVYNEKRKSDRSIQ